MGCGTVRLQRRMTPVGSLKGRRIVVTRAREQAGDLVRALQEHGAEAVIAPVIRIQPLADLGALRAALTGLSAYRWVVFTSQNAVQIVFDRLVAWGLTPCLLVDLRRGHRHRNRRRAHRPRRGAGARS